VPDGATASKVLDSPAVLVLSFRSHVSAQNLYNLTDRGSEDVLDYCEREGIAFIPWYPLASGDVTKPSGPLADVAAMHDATPAQISLAWLLYKSPVMLPIPGANSIEHFEEYIGAGAIELSDEEMSRIEKAWPDSRERASENRTITRMPQFHLAHSE
jgi:aryl-alcohol dehydrogenase-like predicted oxidoreductase